MTADSEAEYMQSGESGDTSPDRDHDMDMRMGGDRDSAVGDLGSYTFVVCSGSLFLGYAFGLMPRASGFLFPLQSWSVVFTKEVLRMMN